MKASKLKKAKTNRNHGIEVAAEMNELMNKHKLTATERVVVLLRYLDVIRLIGEKSVAEFWGAIFTLVLGAELEKAVAKAKAAGDKK